MSLAAAAAVHGSCFDRLKAVPAICTAMKSLLNETKALTTKMQSQLLMQLNIICICHTGQMSTLELQYVN